MPQLRLFAAKVAFIYDCMILPLPSHVEGDQFITIGKKNTLISTLRYIQIGLYWQCDSERRQAITEDCRHSIRGKT
jgi:hypothetical protein